MDDDLKPRSVKIGSQRWARWMAEAKARSMPLTALIIERMDVAGSEAKDIEIAALKKALKDAGNPRVIKSTPALRRVLASCPAIDPKASHPSGPVLTDPRPQNIQGQATGYRPKGAWKADQGKK